MGLMNRCPFCMGDVASTAVTCDSCKLPITAGVCLGCKKQNDPFAEACVHCGGKYLIAGEPVWRGPSKKREAPAPPAADGPQSAVAMAEKPASAATVPAKPLPPPPRTEPERPLPKGFEKLGDALDDASGLPMRARCMADAAEMALIPAGKFLMGAPDGVGASDERPRHEVSLEAFYMDRLKVSVAQFRKFCAATNREMREQPPWSGDSHPVVNVNWYDAAAYCGWTGKSLPTEAEWEKAAGGGADTEYGSGGLARHSLGDYVWYAANSGRQAHPSGQKKPNKYGLYDMPGNVLEWCLDGYDENYYEKTPEADPRGSDSATALVCRGAAWDLDPGHARCSRRGFRQPDTRSDNLGFRGVSAFLAPLNPVPAAGNEED